MTGGKFIVLEGIDGAGTTTQIARLHAYLTALGIDVVKTHEPTNRPLGQACRVALSAPTPPPPRAMALMFSADRFDHEAHVILPALERGAWIVSDRYLMSTLAYQGLKLSRPWLMMLNEGVRRPDLTILLTVAPHIGAARRKLRAGPEELYDASETQRRVDEAYRGLAEGDQGLGPVAVVDGQGSQDSVFELIVAELKQRQWIEL